MSYEGYTQFICKKGHYWTKDCYMADEDQHCYVCNDKAVWENMVNETNGSYDTNPATGNYERIDGYVELEQKKTKTCDKCQSVLEETFKIPRKGGPGRKK